MSSVIISKIHYQLCNFDLHLVNYGLVTKLIEAREWEKICRLSYLKIGCIRLRFRDELR